MYKKFKWNLLNIRAFFHLLKILLWMFLLLNCFNQVFATANIMTEQKLIKSYHQPTTSSMHVAETLRHNKMDTKSSSGTIWITPTHLCDGVACKCGYQLVLCQCVNQVQRIIIKPNDIALGVSNLTITNCEIVHFQTRSIKNITSLRSLNIHNVKRLEIDEKSLEWSGDGMTFIKPEMVDFPKLSIRVTHTNVPDISRYSFNGNIREIIFDYVNVGKVHNFAFSNLNGNEKIHFKNSVIDQIQVQGFKKFTTNHLLIENSTFNSDLISRTFSDIEVRSLLRISDRSRFKQVKPSAFLVTNPYKIEVSDSHFQLLDSEAFKVFVRGDALFRDNYFEQINPSAFVGITANRQPKLDFIFTNNTITQLYDHSLDFNSTSFNVKLYAVNLNIFCTCENIQKWIEWIFITDLRSINCLNDQKTHVGQLITVDNYKNKYCTSGSKILKVVAIVSIILISIIIIIVLCYLYFRYKYERSHKKEWINNASPILSRKSRENSTTNSKNSSLKCVNGKLPMIVPDGRTYRETIVVVEQADLLTTEL